MFEETVIVIIIYGELNMGRIFLAKCMPSVLAGHSWRGLCIETRRGECNGSSASGENCILTL